MTLVKEIAATVAAYPELALLTSDCSGVAEDLHVPPFALMAHGTYQDTHCRPEAWPYGLFPNFRNTVWSCNWASVSNLQFMKFAVDHFDTPVSIGNGSFGDDIGFADLTAEQAGQIVEMFNRRKTGRCVFTGSRKTTEPASTAITFWTTRSIFLTDERGGWRAAEQISTFLDGHRGIPP